MLVVLNSKGRATRNYNEAVAVYTIAITKNAYIKVTKAKKNS